ncbi:hypothetical protein DFH06DRAFT_1177721 [Mycena polygramma]|nr:hypothetical protein DFH06DRAFT_1177721 [Mycena polygramma]
MVDVQAHTARLIALFVSCVLYGILLTTFVPCLRSLLFSSSHRFHVKPHHEIKYPILVATILMFLVSSFGAALAMQDVIDAFINYDGPGGALAFYGGTGNTQDTGWKHWMLAVEDTAQVILGDGLLIYRCYVLHDKNWRAIALPFLSWIALVAMSILSSYHEATLPAGKRLNDPSVIPFLAATLIFTFMTSVITTYLIVRRLFWIEDQPDLRGAIRPHILTRIATISFETGLIYTLSIVASLGVYLAGSNLEYVASLAMIHIIPITCNLLLIRVEGVNGTESLAGTKSSELESESWEVNFNPEAANEV